MASPFRAFRKHQKQWLAVLGIMVMFSFVFLPIALDRMGGGRTRTNVTAVTTNRYGSITEQHLQQLRYQRQMMLGFLNQVAAILREQGAFARDAMQMLNEIGPVDDESVVSTWLLSNRARELGIMVSDKSVKEFLQTVTRGFAYVQPAKDAKDAKSQFKRVQVTNDQFRKILSNLRVGRMQFLEMWRTELMALRLAREFSFSLEAMTPGQRWDYFRRINRRATVEVLPVSVEKFVDQVGDPEPAAAKAFFEQHKEKLQTPDSAEPGFREPHRVAVEYLKADQTKFVDLASVTEEEIKQYYEQFKDIYYREEPEKPAPEKQPSAASPNETRPGEKKEAKPAEKPEAKPDAKPAEKKEAKPVEQKETKPVDKKDSKPVEKKDTKPPEGTPPKLSPAEKKAAPEAKKSSGVTPRSPYRFAAFQAKDAGKPASPPAKAPEPAGKPAQPAAKSEAPASKPAPPALRPPELPAPKPVEPTPKAKEPAPSKGTGPTESKPKESSDKAAAAPPKFIPLDKVKGKIRDTLAQRQANTKVQKVLSGLQDSLEAYHQKWLSWKVAEAKTKGEPVAAPPRPDLKELAKQNGLTCHEIPPVSMWDIKPFDISASTVASGSTDVGSGTPFIAYVFESATEFRPALSQDTQGNSYLFWKVEEIKDRVPSFDDPGVADQVVKTWKRVQARERARKEADGLAEEARQAQKSLTRAFGTRPGFVVTKTEPFSWMSFGAIPPRFASQQSRPQLSEVRGVDRPGDQFMKVAFGLAQGDIGVAPNQPETIYYVIRAVDFTPSADELWNSFRDGADMQSIFSVALRDQQESYRAWRDELIASVGLKWQRDPVRARAE